MLETKSWRKLGTALILVSLVLAQSLSVGNVEGIPLNWFFEGKVPTDSPSNSLPSLAEGPDSTLWLVWQSLPPLPATTSRILLKTYHFPSQVWSNDIAVTSSTESDFAPDVTRLANGTMMVVWFRGNSQPTSNSHIYYKLNDGTAWSPEIRLTLGPFKDLAPSIIEDKSGLLWLIWERRLPEAIVYDTNASGSFDVDDSLISGSLPGLGTVLKPDAKIRYVDLNSNDRWDTGEPVVYDNDNDNAYDAGEPILTFATPASGATLRDDSKIKFVDENNSTRWEFGQSDIYYKTHNGISWSQEFQLTTDSRFDQRPSATQTRDGRIWVAWTSNRNNSQMDIFFKTFDGAAWSADTVLFSDTETLCTPDYPLGCPDDDPDIVQDRDGSIRIFWMRLFPATGSGFQGEIFTIESTDNGSTFPLAGRQRLTLNDDGDGGPSIAKFSDRRLRLFWTRPSGGLPGVVDVLYEKSEPIFTHDAAVTSMVPVGLVVWNTTYQVLVTVINQGDFVETVTVTLRVGGSAVGTLGTSVGAGGTATVTFNMRYDNTTLTPPGRHSLTAVASISVEPAGNLPDNTLTAGTLTMLLPPGDMDHDGDVELVDAVIWTQSYGSTPASPSWNPEADLDGNGIIDMEDAVLFARWIGIRI